MTAPPLPSNAMPPLTLVGMRRMLEGVVPPAMCSVSADGVPHINYLSHAEYVDPEHVALTFQFLNRSRVNVLATGRVALAVDDPYTGASVTLQLQYLRTDTSGPLFERLRAKLAGIAAHTGMEKVFKLQGADLYRVLSLRRVDKLRKQITGEVVPLCAELAKKQAKALGVDKVMMWDEGIHDAQGSPKPHGDHDWMVLRAQEMFDDIGHGLGDFFRLMNEKHLLDLKSREGKAGGGFCTGFPTYGVPFVFANFNGTKGDVEVFTHEMGHAFQNYSARNQQLVDYLWPTFESAEIHSMSLEFITWPWMEKFFNEDADRFRKAHLTGSLMFLPYGTAVDHYQHLVYENPTASPAERFEMWREMERTYLPWRDHGDLPHAGEGGFWQLQRHIYLSPFYYIDYVLAQLCALQFWVRVTEDRDQAMKDYVALCKRGGEAPFQELAKSAGLKSPFEPGALTSIVSQARDWLSERA
jgi:M3 family oligoendopeptidase